MRLYVNDFMCLLLALCIQMELAVDVSFEIWNGSSLTSLRNRQERYEHNDRQCKNRSNQVGGIEKPQ